MSTPSWSHAMVLTLARFLHRWYKLLISPLFGNVCRFEPYCSDYALEAIEKHGIFRGLLLATKRVLKCNPYCKGGHDPVPPERVRSTDLK